MCVQVCYIYYWIVILWSIYFLPYIFSLLSPCSYRSILFGTFNMIYSSIHHFTDTQKIFRSSSWLRCLEWFFFFLHFYSSSFCLRLNKRIFFSIFIFDPDTLICPNPGAAYRRIVTSCRTPADPQEDLPLICNWMSLYSMLFVANFLFGKVFVKTVLFFLFFFFVASSPSLWGYHDIIVSYILR